MDVNHVKELFSKELNEAKSHFEAGRTHLRIARALSEEFGFELPEWAGSESHVAERQIPDSAESTTDAGRSPDEPKSRKKRARREKKVPTMPDMILKYFDVHEEVAEPIDVDTWVRDQYPEADIKEYAIGQTMSRMARGGRLHSKKYPGQHSSVYGPPDWAESGDEEDRGFKHEYLPAELRSVISAANNSLYPED